MEESLKIIAFISFLMIYIPGILYVIYYHFQYEIHHKPKYNNIYCFDCVYHRNNDKCSFGGIAKYNSIGFIGYEIKYNCFEKNYKNDCNDFKLAKAQE